MWATIMEDLEVPVERRRGKFGWFAGGTLLITAAIGLFLYSDGVFDSAPRPAEMPEVFIEAN